MRIKAFLYAGVAGIALAATGALATGAQAQTLTGAVSSAEEGAMEGVLVSAKKAGSTITTTVVLERQGPVQLPGRPARARPLHASPSAPPATRSPGPKEVDVAAGGASADLKLAKVTAKNVQAQLSNAEWLLSAPGADQIKSFLPDCVGCHTLQRVYLRDPHAGRMEAGVHPHGPLCARERADPAAAPAPGRPAQRAAARSRRLMDAGGRVS